MDSGPLTHEERRFLLRLARSTLEARLAGDRLPEPHPMGGRLAQPRGAFVTLTANGELRGCIGHVVGAQPLWRSVRDNAVAAAFRDPRFPPLTTTELDPLRIEISILTPLRRVETVEEIEVGRDGLMVEKGGNRGLLLPQVASERGWDRETFLTQTCRKAGLDSNAWRDPGSTIHAFSAEIFSEEQH